MSSVGSKFGSGDVSSGPSVDAHQPMPRVANTFQSVSQSSLPCWVQAAWTIALRMSRNVGSSGARRSPPVTYARARLRPSCWPCAATSAERIDHSVCPQISPSACGSGPLSIRPKSL